MSEVIINLTKFLDMLQGVLPCISIDETRYYLRSVKLEVNAEKNIISAISTDGHTLAYKERKLGFSKDEQSDIEDINKKIENHEWLIKKEEIELLVQTLKKLQSNAKKIGNEAIMTSDYVCLSEEKEKQILNISIYGTTKIAFSCFLMNATYPNWESIIPKDLSLDNISHYQIHNLAKIKKVFHEFKNCSILFDTQNRASKIIPFNEPEKEKENDCFIIMPVRKLD